MVRPTRSFKLKLSPEGMDLLIDAHCRLIRATRRLLAWGTTLHVAVTLLEALPAAQVAESFVSARHARFMGAEEHHLGAPYHLSATAALIAKRIGGAAADRETPSLACIYLLALQQVLRADNAELHATFDRTRSSTMLPTE